MKLYKDYSNKTFSEFLPDHLTISANIFLITLILITLFPILALIATIVRIYNGKPILYKQPRMGFKSTQFILYKFRTMKNNAHAEQKKYMKLNEADGPVFKIHNDPRFTRIGKFLSHTGLDELPQLFNVLKGEMSLIGPRPLPLEEAKKLKPWQQKRHSVKPGIISPWVLNGYHSTQFDKWMLSDCRYAQNKSLKTDSLLFFRGIWLLCRLIFSELTKIVCI